MDSKKNTWLKKIGIAGFLFFFIKGLLWLIFGAAAWKWLQSIFALIFIVGITFTQKVYAQYTPEKKIANIDFQDLTSSTINTQMVTSKLTLFCAWEKILDNRFQLPFAIRLGNLFYTRSLEYPYLYQYKIPACP